MTSHGKCTVEQRNGYLCHQNALFVVGNHQACRQHVASALLAAFELSETMSQKQYEQAYRNNVLGVSVQLKRPR